MVKLAEDYIEDSFEYVESQSMGNNFDVVEVIASSELAYNMDLEVDYFDKILDSTGDVEKEIPRTLNRPKRSKGLSE